MKQAAVARAREVEIAKSMDQWLGGKQTTPTQRTYKTLDDAYKFFNARLFDNRLPACLVTLQRRAGARGYFSSQRFGSEDGREVTDEIAMNPQHFRGRSVEQVLSTLVHEMAHLEQAHFGQPSRGRYHNKQWALMMRAVGLIPSDTGEPGGKEVGQRVTHYIERGGRFEVACAGLKTTPLYVDLQDSEQAKKKAASKTKYTCPSCGVNAWAKPDVALICGDCGVALEADEAERKVSSATTPEIAPAAASE